MGMFDTIHAEVDCPYCGGKIIICEQIKWGPCILSDFHIGDEVTDTADGVYTWATYVRPTFEETCRNCGRKIKYNVIIKYNKFDSVEIEEG